MEGPIVRGLTLMGREEERFVCLVVSPHHDNNNAPIQEGRVDGLSDGYVQGYKHKGTYGSGMARTR